MKKEYEYNWEIFEVLDEKIIRPWLRHWMREHDYHHRSATVDANMKYSLGGHIYNHIQELNLTIINLKTKLSLEQQDRESEKRTYKTRIEAAEGYIEKLKKSREVLRKFVDYCCSWNEGEIVTSGFDSPWIAKEAREAIKADDEIMVVGNG